MSSENCILHRPSLSLELSLLQRAPKSSFLSKKSGQINRLQKNSFEDNPTQSQRNVEGNRSKNHHTENVIKQTMGNMQFWGRIQWVSECQVSPRMRKLGIWLEPPSPAQKQLVCLSSDQLIMLKNSHTGIESLLINLFKITGFRE